MHKGGVTPALCQCTCFRCRGTQGQIVVATTLDSGQLNGYVIGRTWAQAGICTPPWARRRIAMICASVYLLVFIRILFVHIAEEILLFAGPQFRGGLPEPLACYYNLFLGGLSLSR
jgi:hypothetical protein